MKTTKGLNGCLNVQSIMSIEASGDEIQKQDRFVANANKRRNESVFSSAI